MTIITSRSNPKIKAIRALRRKKTRQERSAFLVEGIHHVGEAAEAGVEIDSILYAPELLRSEFASLLIDQLSNANVPCYPASSEVFKYAAEKENPQGILAVVRQFETELDELTSQNFARGVAILSPQDPGNIGTIMRTIDAVGASGLILIDSSADPFHPNAVRASMGALFWKSISHTSFSEFSNWTKKRGYTVYGSSAHGDLDYTEIDSHKYPYVLLMGSEREGLKPEHKKICANVLRIPVQGRTSSLNLGVATGILLYSMMSTRTK
jgi:TrmH family RNA methyltransferase